MKSSIEVAREIRNAISSGVTEQYTAAQIDEVWKPLVDAITRAKALIGFLQSCILSGEPLNPKDSQYIRSVLDQCDAALAQCKE